MISPVYDLFFVGRINDERVCRVCGMVDASSNNAANAARSFHRRQPNRYVANNNFKLYSIIKL